MGRTAKFFFPLPGRKSTKESEKLERVPSKSSSGFSSRQSKAQRILGTGDDLNIDSPTRSYAPSWNNPGSRSSGMSITISESTHSTRSTTESGSISGSSVYQWEQESGIFGTRRAVEKASSTILGQQYRDDGITDASSLGRRMRHEASDSTLKSYYDRQKSPLSISQQTSESSTRDQALRKGYPPISRSPLLQVDSIDRLDVEFVGNNGDLSRDASTRKKPARLDLSMLSSSKQRKAAAAESMMSPASIMSNTTNGSLSRNSSSNRRKLSKVSSKESMQSRKQSIRSTQSERPRHSYDNYEHLPVRPYPMGRIPESRVPGLEAQSMNVSSGGSKLPRPANLHLNAASESQKYDRPRTSTSHPSPVENQGFLWKNVRQWDQGSSGASISSRNTRTSRHTSTSVFSSSDLKQSSVLSLSSDSEGDLSDDEQIASPAAAPPPSRDKPPHVMNGATPRNADNRHLPVPKPQQLSATRKGSRKGAAFGSSFHPIPEAALPDPRISGPWSPPDTSKGRVSGSSQQSEPLKRKSPKNVSSLSSSRGLHPPPKLSPMALEVRESRYMAVTKQEEQLLEALRQKRANMRKEIIEEHEIAKAPSPPHKLVRRSSRYSELSQNSSISTIRGPDSSSSKEQILLYLDTPVSDIQTDAPEPSPDLSDFLSFGSDGDSPPTTSWQPPQKTDPPRPDSAIRKGDKISPMTPPSAARLSAVGAGDFLRPTHGSTRKRKDVGQVRFAEEEKAVNSQDFLLDESETDVIWGMQ